MIINLTEKQWNDILDEIQTCCCGCGCCCSNDHKSGEDAFALLKEEMRKATEANQ